jgi:antitoxin VapB
MALNIKNPEVERLAAELAAIGQVSKTEAIRLALLQQKRKIEDEKEAQFNRVLKWLQEDVWSKLPPEDRVPLTKEQEEEILGYGPDGV